MFGINLLNPFSLGDTVETSTIIWLRLFLLSVIIASSYVAYITTIRWVQYVAYILITLSLFSFFWYLNTGSILPGLGGSCSYCPVIGSDSKTLGSGSSVTIPVTVPTSNPFTTTHLYYVVIQDALGTDTGRSQEEEMGSSFIEWDDYYRLAVDRTTGMLYFRTYKQSPSDSVKVSPLPFGTLVQIAIIQNQKTFAVCVNGERKVTIRSPSLPLSAVLSRTPVFNRDGVVNSGVVYHTEIHNTLLDTPDLLRHRESVIAVYSNSSLFQNTPLPKMNRSLSFVERASGYARLTSNQFSYPKVLGTGLNSLQEQNG